MTGFRYPNITGATEREQLQQLKSYLYQLVEQLNHTAELSGTPRAGLQAGGSASSASEKQADPAADFAALKGLIIKSADIVEAYSEKLEKQLVGKYVSASEFGSYAEATRGQITANATKIDQNYESLQTIVTDLESRFLETRGYIRTGVLFYAEEKDPLPAGAPVYGLEVGQEAEDGTFRRFSRFTSYSLCFFDSQGEEFASLMEGKLTVRHGVIQQSFTLGGFTDEVLPDGGLVTRWKGV